ncbi:Pre-mRNA-splicing factor [Drechslerella dactyloides]|uniref:Pre-mRNA-splicing factor n=1 Tax=Drechslerella dactyloides TaxID=74499 RepID=A0AAD6IRK8_DREDA|nr:Pre-mRNA-splicing factor [Drechslerella dactyloides]
MLGGSGGKGHSTGAAGPASTDAVAIGSFACRWRREMERRRWRTAAEGGTGALPFAILCSLVLRRSAARHLFPPAAPDSSLVFVPGTPSPRPSINPPPPRIQPPPRRVPSIGRVDVCRSSVLSTMTEVISGMAALPDPDEAAAASTPAASSSSTKPRKLTKNQLKRERKKHKKEIARQQSASSVADSDTESVASTATIASSASSFVLPPGQKQQQVQLSLVPEVTPNFDLSDLNLDQEDASFAEYQRIMQKFATGEDGGENVEEKKGEVFYDEDDIPDEEAEQVDVEARLSKKARKARDKLSVAELKVRPSKTFDHDIDRALVKRPEIVEWTDTSSSDPRLLVHLKSYRNCVPVPGHWSLKREYLSSKRGVEKPPFDLPAFIKATGIMEMRDNTKDDERTLKQKQRERVQPKMGKLDIDYQKLHDAFFRFQVKPPLTMYGEVYYEGKEMETNLKDRRPGELSEELKEALNMPPNAPPPWLINMQRVGPPPSYPSLKIAGLNAPIPAGAAWGFHPGGWGKPPVDEFNRPLYGDVFGVLQPQESTEAQEPIDRAIWGELQEIESEEEDESEEESEEEDEEDVGAGLQTPSGMATPSGMISAVPSEFDAPDYIELRKSRPSDKDEEDGPKSLYSVLPEQEIRSRGLFGGQHAYDLSKGGQMPVLGQEDRKRKKPGDIDVSIDAAALEADDGLSKEAIKAKYEREMEQQHRDRQGFQEDLSDLIASESRKRQKREEDNARKKKESKFRF